MKRSVSFLKVIAEVCLSPSPLALLCCYGNRAGPGGASGWRLVAHMQLCRRGAAGKVASHGHINGEFVETKRRGREFSARNDVKKRLFSLVFLRRDIIRRKTRDVSAGGENAFVRAGFLDGNMS